MLSCPPPSCTAASHAVPAHASCVKVRHQHTVIAEQNAHLCCVSRLLGGLCSITDRLLSWGAVLVVVIIDGFRMMGK